jgi:hypothetical protein
MSEEELLALLKQRLRVQVEQQGPYYERGPRLVVRLFWEGAVMGDDRVEISSDYVELEKPR